MTEEVRAGAIELGSQHARLNWPGIPQHSWTLETGFREGWGVYRKSYRETFAAMSPEEKKAAALRPIR